MDLFEKITKIAATVGGAIAGLLVISTRVYNI